MKKNRILALSIAVMLVIALLAGCGTGMPGAQNAGNAEGEVSIGVLAPLTGPVAQFGVAVQAGVQLYVDQFNAQGGLQISLEFFDEEGQAAMGVAGYHDLVDRGVDAIIGAVTSGVTMAVVPLAYDDNMPMITATSTHANVTVDADTGAVFTNMFRSCFIDPYQGTKMAEFAYEVVGAQTVAILYSNEIDYSIGLYEAFEIRANELGMDVVAVEIFPDEAIDFRSQLTNIAAADPDVLFVPAYYRHIALIGPQSVDVGLQDTVLMGADGWATILDFMDDGSSLEGAFFMTGFSPEVEDPLAQQFFADFNEATGTAPSMFAAQAYDAAKILIAAIETALAGGATPDDVAPFREAVIAAMAATDINGVTGHITFDQYNNPQKTAVILVIQDGEERLWGTF
ncbi:MAG: ABC transporter substrate-binding protein [Oscillospiraceae bacterium]|nr:ABC transporter substrate-binding protein [Oscillospiraceae bacterium]